MDELNETAVQPEMQIDVDPGTAMAIKVQEFDKRIAEAEFVVSDLKKQRAEYIYQTNIQVIISQHKAKQAQTQS